MSFNNFSSSVKLGNIKSYSVKNTNDTFKNSFYTNTENIDYTVYEDIDYNVIDLQKGIEEALKEPAPELLDSIGSFFASAANTVMGFAEGILQFGEDILDAACWVGAVANSWPNLLYDLGSGIFTGDWDFSSTTQHLNTAAEFISVDLVDEAYDWLYEEGPFKAIEEASFPAFKRDGGVVYGISKSSGYYAAATVTSNLIAPGVGPVMAKGLSFGVSKFGNSVESGLNDIKTNDDGTKREASLLEMAGVTATSAVKGTVEGGIMGGAEKLKLLGKAKELSDGKIFLEQTALKMTKPLASEVIELVEGDEFSWEDVAIETTAVAISETVNFGVGKLNTNIKSNLKSNSKAPSVSQESVSAQENWQPTSDSKSTSQFLDATKTGLEKAGEKALKEGVKDRTRAIFATVGLEGEK